MILLWSERKLLARIVFNLNFLSNTVSLVSSLFVFFAVAIVLSIIKLLLIQQSNLDCACAVDFYSMTAPPLFQFTVLSGLARLRIKEVQIGEVLL